ncbi:FliC/FljB family flagellin [Halomonas kalidii]|uniref:Flagellin n=1 Tax=Halomonas kalidii TaxID=3043293 RepID=A0ABT6VND5_9GAMM|nr:FliC/FljB family flagellin [Halomonas kalidii]MDI5935170.1 FliC/FljB family flagellin [Halomonas kalidii]
MSVINTNITSMIGQSNLNKSQSALQTSMERLSSGLRINSAKDDAAGQAIANRMSSQITGLSQAQRNANDGISVAQTAEGALNQVNDNLQRIRELTVQAQNDTNSDDDLQSIQDEIGQRLNEINRISEETSFNGVQVLASDQGLQIQVGANDGESITVNLEEITSETLKLDSFDVTKGVVLTDSLGATSANGDTVSVSSEVFTLNADTDTDGANPVTTDGEVYVDDNGNYFVQDADNPGDYYAATVTTDGTDVDVDFDSDSGTASPTNPVVADSVQVDVTVSALGANESLREINDADGNGTGEFVIQGEDADGNAVYSAATVGLDGAVTKGDELQADPLASLDSALKQVDSLRSELGAVQNRFESAITNLQTNETNLSAARSRIEDADYAVEVANMTRAQILQQAGTSVLAQANQVPQNVLSLLG